MELLNTVHTGESHPNSTMTPLLSLATFGGRRSKEKLRNQPNDGTVVLFTAAGCVGILSPSKLTGEEEGGKRRTANCGQKDNRICIDCQMREYTV